VRRISALMSQLNLHASLWHESRVRKVCFRIHRSGAHKQSLPTWIPNIDSNATGDKEGFSHPETQFHCRDVFASRPEAQIPIEYQHTGNIKSPSGRQSAVVATHCVLAHPRRLRPFTRSSTSGIKLISFLKSFKEPGLQ